jgi:bifunctional DNA-binding transcriptional regulator/antitoxin component of YhaV-PrlF toxin-antitoxin module
MLTTMVTDTGQITLHDEIRQHLKLVSGSRVEFVIAEYRKAIQIDPNYAYAHSNLGDALKDKERKKK